MYDLAVVVAVLVGAWFGSTAGLLPAATLAFELFAGFAAAVLVHEMLGGLLAAVLRMALEPVLGLDFPFQGVAVALVFALVTWGTFAALRLLYHPEKPIRLEAQPAEEPRPPLTRLAGGVAGGLAGFIGAGAALVTLSMLPLPGLLRPVPARMIADAGGVLLRAACRFEPDVHENRSLVADGEPPARPSEAGAGLTSEPWIDADGDGSFSEPDRWHDVDGNGTFTAGLAFLDLDGDGARRIGLVEKYATGAWNGLLDIAAPPPDPAAGPEGEAAAPPSPGPRGRAQRGAPAPAPTPAPASPTAPQDDF
jgi:hypothetical protein